MSIGENNLKSLTRQTKVVSCVINFPCKSPKLFNLAAYNLPKFAEDLERCCFLYAFIVHDHDVDDNGEYKTVHIHLYLCSDKRHQLKYYIYLLSDLLQVSEELISVRVSNSDAGDIQYLVHRNNKEKYQYNVEDIKTNIPKDMFEEMMTRKIINTFTVDELIRLCEQYDKLEIMKIIGAERYNHYSKVIDTIIKELRFKKSMEYRRIYTRVSNN